jgi:hypothetical protein
LFLDLRQKFFALAQVLQPVVDVDREIELRHNELRGIEDTLEQRKREVADRDAMIQARDRMIAKLERMSLQKENHFRQIEAGQVDAISEWLLNKYPGEAVHGDAKDRRMIVTTTLFGTFVADYPSSLPSNAPAEINIIFAPTVFQEDLWPGDLSLGIRDYSSDIVRYIGLKEAFDKGRLVPIKGLRPVRWTWTMRSPADFTGVTFNIRALVRRASNNGVEKHNDLLVELPVRISSLPGPIPLWKVVLSGIAGGALAAEALRQAIRYLWRMLTTKKKGSSIILPG